MHRVNASFLTAPQVNASQPPQPSSAQGLHRHPSTLAPATLSLNTQLALDQFGVQPDGHYQLLALLVRNGITDGALELHSSQGAEVRYHQEVDVPGASGVLGARQIGNLTVRAKLNEQAQYDILDIDFHIPSSGAKASITLRSDPPTAVGGTDTPEASQGKRLGPSADLYSPGGSVEMAMRGERRPRAYAMAPDALHGRGLSTPLTNLLPSTNAPSSVGSRSRMQVLDPENPGKMISQHSLNQRAYNREQLPDPERPGKTASRNALLKRKSDRQRVPDPKDLGKTMSVNARQHRDALLRQVPDPDNPGLTTNKTALNHRKLDRRQVPDPNNPGKTIARGAWVKQMRVADPENPGKKISPNVLDKREAQRAEDAASDSFESAK